MHLFIAKWSCWDLNSIINEKAFFYCFLYHLKLSVLAISCKTAVKSYAEYQFFATSVKGLQKYLTWNKRLPAWNRWQSVCLDQRPCLRILIFMAGGINLNAAHSVTLKTVGSSCMNSCLTSCTHIIDWQVIFSHSLNVYSAYHCVGKVAWLINANDMWKFWPDM